MLSKFLHEPNLDKYLAQFGFTKKFYWKRRLLYTTILGLFGLMWAASSASTVAYFSIPILLFVGYKYPYYALYKRNLEMREYKSYAFAKWTNTFLSLLNTQGNIYQTLVASIEFTDSPLKERLMHLVDEVEVSNEYKHYISFAEYIGNTEALMVMSMIYSFSIAGVQKDELLEMERLVEEIKVNKMSDMVTRKAKEQEKYANYAIYLTVFFILVFVGTAILQNIQNLRI